MPLTHKTTSALIACLLAMACAAPASAQATGDIYTAVAAVKTASGATAETPMAFTIERKMPPSEVNALLAAFKTGGAAGLRKALAGVAPTGSVRVGAAKPTPSRLTLERATPTGKLVTIVTDQPVTFVGATPHSGKATAGYDFAVIDLIVDARGNGTGTVAAAARITVTQGVFVVADSATEAVRLAGVKKVR